MNLYGYKNSSMTFCLLPRFLIDLVQLQGFKCEFWILYVYRGFFRSSWSITGILYDFVQFQCIIYDQCFKNDIVRLPGFIYNLVRLPGYIYDLVRLQGFIYELSFFAEIFNWNCTITGIQIWHFVLLPRYSMNLYDYRTSYITFCFITENFKWPCMITGIPVWPFAFLPRF